MHHVIRTTIIGLMALGLSLQPIPVVASDGPEGPNSASIATETVLFADLSPDHWAYESIAALTRAGVVNGSPDGYFRPDEPVTRAELVKMTLAARRIDPGTMCEGVLVDVPCWAWYAAYTETAYRMAIIEGDGQGRFVPDGAVSRQQLVTIVLRAMGLRWAAASQSWSTIDGRLESVSDRGHIEPWARPSAALAVAQNLVTGYPDGNLRPLASTSRGEAAALISRILVSDEGVATAEIAGRRIVYVDVRDMTASAYATGEPGVGTITYTGVTVRDGTVAVDPTVIPLGSLLYVEGYGYAVAADIGGAIKGERIDLFTHNFHLADVLFGLQPRRVWVLP